MVSYLSCPRSLLISGKDGTETRPSGIRSTLQLLSHVTPLHCYITQYNWFDSGLPWGCLSMEGNTHNSGQKRLPARQSVSRKHRRPWDPCRPYPLFHSPPPSNFTSSSPSSRLSSCPRSGPASALHSLSPVSFCESSPLSPEPPIFSHSWQHVSGSPHLIQTSPWTCLLLRLLRSVSFSVLSRRNCFYSTPLIHSWTCGDPAPPVPMEVYKWSPTDQFQQLPCNQLLNFSLKLICLYLSPCPPSECWSSTFEALLLTTCPPAPLTSTLMMHIGFLSPGQSYSSSQCLSVHLPTTNIHWEILFVAHISYELTISLLLSPNKPTCPPVFSLFN